LLASEVFGFIQMDVGHVAILLEDESLAVGELPPDTERSWRRGRRGLADDLEGDLPAAKSEVRLVNRPVRDSA